MMAERHTDNTPYAFVSYASADRERVLPVVAALERAGIGVWIDREGIHGGESYAAEIDDAIERCAAFVLMASAAALGSRNVRQELALGWRYERPYLPLLLEAVEIPKEVRYWLEASQWTEVLDRPEQQWLPAVLTALEPLGIAPAPPHAEERRLAGREKELALLREKVASAKEGTGGLVLIGGEAGIGKTTLAKAALQEAAQQGCVVLEGHCFDLADTPPYGPWLYLFARYQPGGALPSLPPAFAEPGIVGAVASQAALLKQVQGFMRDLSARRPLMLLLDDYHWADAASLDLLRYLAQSVSTLPLLLVVTYRSDELTRRHPLYQLLPLLVREANATRLDLRRLTDDDMRLVIVARYDLPDGDAARLTAYLQERAEGNPFFSGELLRTLEEEAALRRTDGGWRLGDVTQVRVPALLRQVIDGRLARLGEDAQHPLAVAAVIGQEVPLDLWATIAEADENALLEIVERGVEARLLEESPDGTRIRFAHALIREALYEGLLATRRRRMHRQIGEALTLISHSDPDAVAGHFQRAGDARAAEWLTKAGERAQRTYAYLTASERFEAALAVMERNEATAIERGWLLYRLAMLRRHINPYAGLAHLDVATHLAATRDDRVLAAHVLFSQGLLHCMSGDVGVGLGGFERGVAALESLPVAETAWLSGRDIIDPVTGRGLFVYWLAVAGRFAEACAMGEGYLAGAPMRAAADMDEPHHGAARTGLAMIYGHRGQLDAARHAFQRIRDTYGTVGDHFHFGVCIMQELNFLILPYYTERIAERQHLAADAERAWGQADLRRERSVRLPCAELLYVEGEWDEAGRITTTEHARGNEDYLRATASVVLGKLLYAQQEGELGWSLVRELLPDGPETAMGTTFYQTAVAMQRLAAAMALDANDLATANEWLEAHDRWLAWSGAVLGLSEGQALWSQYHRQAGDIVTASAHAERALAHATEPRQPLALLAAHRLLGELDTAARRYEDAARHLDESLQLADACAAPYERALTLLAMAELHTARGEAEAAQTLLDEVKAICEPLGAKPALARADALAARLVGG